MALHGKKRTLYWLTTVKFSSRQLQRARNMLNGMDALTSAACGAWSKGVQFGHVSTGQRDANPESRSVSLWFKAAKNGTDVRVVGIGTHVPVFRGNPAYRMRWKSSASLPDRFYLNGNAVKEFPTGQ